MGRAKRLALGVCGVLLLLGTFAGGVVTGRSTGDEPAEGITESEHGRLVDVCVGEGGAPSACASYMAGVVDRANAEGFSYQEIVADLEEFYDER